MSYRYNVSRAPVQTRQIRYVPSIELDAEWNLRLGYVSPPFGMQAAHLMSTVGLAPRRDDSLAYRLRAVMGRDLCDRY